MGQGVHEQSAEGAPNGSEVGLVLFTAVNELPVNVLCCCSDTDVPFNSEWMHGSCVKEEH